MHCAADITGAEIMRTLRDEARNRAEDIKVLEFSPAVELILNEHGIVQVQFFIIWKQKNTSSSRQSSGHGTGGSGGFIFRSS